MKDPTFLRDQQPAVELQRNAQSEVQARRLVAEFQANLAIVREAMRRLKTIEGPRLGER